MSKALIMALELIKEECNKHDFCKECFYSYVSEEGFMECIIGSYYPPSEWDLSELEKKEC